MQIRFQLSLFTNHSFIINYVALIMAQDAPKRRFLSLIIIIIPSTCACGEVFTVDHSMICKLGGFVIQRHNELRDREAELLSTVCSDVETEPVLLDISGEQLSRGSNKAQDVRLDIHARGFWEQQRSAFSDVRVCHPNAESHKDLKPQQIYRTHENEKKRLYSRRVLDIEHGTYTPFCLHYNRRNGKGMLEIP